MSSKQSKLKQPSFKSVSASDELKYKRKYKELKKKIREMEEENEKLTLKLTRAKKNIQRLRIERSFLFDRLEQSQPNNDSDSDQSSQAAGAESEEELSSSEEALLEALEDQPSGKRRRPNKDPNAPKRPRNAFLMYCQIEREQAKEENANKGFQDVTRILSQRWKDLSTEEKQKYYDMYNKEKQRYEKEMSTYVGSSLAGSDSIAIPNTHDYEDDLDEDETAAANDNDNNTNNSRDNIGPSVEEVGESSRYHQSDLQQSEGDGVASTSTSKEHVHRHTREHLHNEQFHNSILNNNNNNNNKLSDDGAEEDELENDEVDADDVVLLAGQENQEGEISEEVDELRDDIEVDEDEEGREDEDAIMGENSATDVDAEDY